MFHCVFRPAYTEDDQSTQRFRQLFLNIWDPSKLGESGKAEAYDDIDESIARLHRIGNDASFDQPSRECAIALANRLERFKQGTARLP